MVQFNITAGHLSLTDYADRLKQFPGKVLVSIGGSQPDEQTKAGKKTIEGSLQVAKMEL